MSEPRRFTDADALNSAIFSFLHMTVQTVRDEQKKIEKKKKKIMPRLKV
jgi:hypothetical protein